MEFCYVPSPCAAPNQAQICFDRWVKPVPESIRHVWPGDQLTFKNNTRGVVTVSLAPGASNVFSGANAFPVQVPPAGRVSVAVATDARQGFVGFSYGVMLPDELPLVLPSPGVDIDEP
jgi:hypothetical protein